MSDLPASYDSWRTDDGYQEPLEASYDEVADLEPELASMWDEEWAQENATEICDLLDRASRDFVDHKALLFLKRSLREHREEKAAQWAEDNQERLQESRGE